MFGVGLSLSVSDFSRIFRYPKDFFTALGIQMLGLPFIAFLLHGIWSPLADEIKVGFIILAASPGGATSGFLAYLWRANVALSLSITAVNSFLTLITLPVITNFGLYVFLGRTTHFSLPLLQTMGHIFAIAIIPAMLGMFTRHRFPKTAAAISVPAKYVMLALLAVVFFVKLFANPASGGSGLKFEDFLLISPLVILQNGFCLFVGYGVMKWMGAKHTSALTAAFESGVQNTTLAFLIAGTFLQSEEMVKPALVYSLFSFWTACVFAYFSNKMNDINNFRTRSETT
jgi:BASS family bile acid:Na+ symporter